MTTIITESTNEEQPHSLRAAINKTCKDCVSPDRHNGWRKEVLQCQGKSCGLYPVRPLPRGYKHTEQGVIKVTNID